MSRHAPSVAAPAAGAVAVPNRRVLGYAAGSVGTGVFSTVPGLLLLFYLTDTLGVPAALAGLVVLLPKAWDVLFNPIVGAFSDREAQRSGGRTRLMLLGACTLPPGFALMFASPWTGPAGAAWVFVAFVLAATAYAFFQVPYVALPTEMSERAAERTRVIGWRIVALTLGILVGGALAPVLVSRAGGGLGGYRTMGIVVAAVTLVVLLLAGFSSRWVRAKPGARSLSLGATFAAARGNRAFIVLVAAYALQSLAIAMVLAAIAYVATYFQKDYTLTSWLFVAVVAPSIVAVPLWTKLATRWGKTRTYRLIVGSWVAALLLMLPALLSGSRTAVLAVAAVQGVLFAGQQVLPLSMLPDTILADTQRSGHSQAGAFTGAWTALETAMYAIGPGAFSLILAVSGFESSTFAHPVVQSALALDGIAAGFTVLPALLMLASLPLIARYGVSAAARLGDE